MQDIIDGSDQSLWDATLAGDTAALSELFRRHHRAVYNYCFRRVSSWAEAEDLTSGVFLELWRTRQPLDLPSGSLLPWLIGISTRLTHRHFRSEVRRRRATMRLAAENTAVERDHAERIDGQVDDERAMAEVLAAIADLPQIDQDVIGACIFAELDYASAAEALGIPIGTVRSRLFRARARLVRRAPHLVALRAQHG
ncbi:RNA polymerase sigma factor [Janibacter sp. GXQ6167]|uniref:RNA polymerase sigma factor n=1 Tax=Janibacter sp. GXQ6167 TaxID=3240791 RepID=UPI003526516B